MKCLWCLVMVIACLNVSAQRIDLPQTFIDGTIRSYDSSLPAQLLHEIIKPSQSDKEKVFSIFRWITENISYNTRASAGRSSWAIYEDPDDDDTASVLKPLNLRVAETVLRREKGVCDGYARLFKTLCDYAGIPSSTITGYARANWGRRTSFGSNHTWNAVYVDGAWHLLDVTWATGHTNYKGDEFYRQYDSKYFFTDPSVFVFDHYPDDIRWTLLINPPYQPEFNKSPFRYMGYIKTGINSFYPAKGIIEASIGDSIRFEVNSSVAQGILEVVSGEQPRDSIGNDDDPVIYGGRRKTCTYKVTEESGEWLYVICNGYVVLRYKLMIRHNGEQVATLLND